MHSDSRGWVLGCLFRKLAKDQLPSPVSLHYANSMNVSRALLLSKQLAFQECAVIGLEYRALFISSPRFAMWVFHKIRPIIPIIRAPTSSL